MATLMMCSAATTPYAGARLNDLTAHCSQIRRAQVNTILVTGKGVRCYATQTQNVQRESSIATIKGADPKGKVKGPKLDDGKGGFPPFRFGEGGGGGGGGWGGGSHYFGGFFLFACVLLLDYLKEAEKNLLGQGHASGDQASIGLAQ